MSSCQGASSGRRDAVLEIGTEEMPARLFPELLSTITEIADRLLKEERVDYSSVKAYATPRRLVLYIKDVAPFGSPLVREVRGPTYGCLLYTSGHWVTVGRQQSYYNEVEATCSDVRHIQDRLREL